jgi:hypothetical protein
VPPNSPRTNALMSNRFVSNSRQHGDKKMKPLSTIKKHLTAAGMTLVIAALAANASWTRPQETAPGQRHFVQYCVPQQGDGVIGQEIYCESGLDRMEAPAFATPERA